MRNDVTSQHMRVIEVTATGLKKEAEGVTTAYRCLAAAAHVPFIQPFPLLFHQTAVVKMATPSVEQTAQGRQVSGADRGRFVVAWSAQVRAAHAHNSIVVYVRSTR